MATWARLLLLLLITLAGLGVRLAGVEWGQGFRWYPVDDELEAYTFALQYGAGESPATYLGHPNARRGSKVPGPLLSLVWLNGLRLAGGPEGLLVLVALLNAAVIPLTYLLGARLYDPEVGLWAAAFLALSPWPVCYSVGLWNPVYLPFLGAGLSLALAKVLTEPRSPAVTWLVLILALLPQVHLVGVFVLPACLALLLLTRTRLHWPRLGLGLAVAVLLYLPYLRQEAVLDWQNTRWLLASTASGFNFGVFRVLTLPLVLVSNYGISWITIDMGEYLAVGSAVLGSFLLLLLLNLASLAWTGWSFCLFGREVKAAWSGLWRRPRLVLAERPGLVVVLLLAGLSMLLASLAGSGFRERYGALFLPLLFLLPALAAARWGRGRPWRPWLTTGLVLLLLANAGFILGYYHHQAGRLAGEEEFLPSFRNIEAVRQALVEAVGDEAKIRLGYGPYLAATGAATYQARWRSRWIENLARYVNLRESHDPRFTRSPGWQELVLVRAADLRPGDEVIYRRHGLAVVKPDQGPPRTGPWEHNYPLVDDTGSPWEVLVP